MTNDATWGERTAETTFAMDPDAVLRGLARQVCDMQQTVAALTRGAAALRADPRPEDNNAHVLGELTARLDELRTSIVPTVAAAMKVALEFHDSYGSGHTVVEDPIEAAIWNNKYFVWHTEFGTHPIT